MARRLMNIGVHDAGAGCRSDAWTAPNKCLQAELGAAEMAGLPSGKDVDCTCGSRRICSGRSGACETDQGSVTWQRIPTRPSATNHLSAYRVYRRTFDVKHYHVQIRFLDLDASTRVQTLLQYMNSFLRHASVTQGRQAAYWLR